MKISIITVFPELHEQFIKQSLIGRAIESGLIEINLIRFSDLCAPKKRIDEPTAGPGAGMIIKPEVVERAITACEQQHGVGYKIFFSPQGTKLTQPVLKKMATQFDSFNKLRPNGVISPNHSEQAPCAVSNGLDHLILICSRYEGIDTRVEAHYADAVISIGDYVLMGGDIPAQVFLEGLLRLIPGIVGRQESVEKESFSGPFLDHPEYGLPVEWKGMRIPDIVQSGNHGAIEEWRQEEACKKTITCRFDWFRSAQPSAEAIKLAKKHIPNHYAALMHTQVMLKSGTVGTTSITSIDLHDTARSCSTYGIKNFFMVSPLADQQAILSTFMDFWKSEEGRLYNQSRYHAVNKVKPTYSLDEVITDITAQEGQAPIIVATSAKTHTHNNIIDYHSQQIVWQHNRPVLFLFGTGQGLCEELLAKCDYLLIPVEGMTDYNHLSVRSAIAIVLDRWLGLQPHLE
jgi:tRNA (guanine37-N1)-methyltransferase